MTDAPDEKPKFVLRYTNGEPVEDEPPVDPAFFAAVADAEDRFDRAAEVFLDPYAEPREGFEELVQALRDLDGLRSNAPDNDSKLIAEDIAFSCVAELLGRFTWHIERTEATWAHATGVVQLFLEEACDVCLENGIVSHWTRAGVVLMAGDEPIANFTVDLNAREVRACTQEPDEHGCT